MSINNSNICRKPFSFSIEAAPNCELEIQDVHSGTGAPGAEVTVYFSYRNGKGRGEIDGIDYDTATGWNPYLFNKREKEEGQTAVDAGGTRASPASGLPVPNTPSPATPETAHRPVLTPSQVTAFNAGNYASLPTDFYYPPSGTDPTDIYWNGRFTIDIPTSITKDTTYFGYLEMIP